MSGPIKSVIGPTRTRLINQIGQANDLLVPARNATERDIKSVIIRIENSIRVLEVRNKEWSQLIQVTDADERATAIAEYTTYTTPNDSFVHIMDQGRAILDELQVFLLGLGGTAVASRVRLPLLGLPHFFGNIADYPQFWSAFEASVDADPSIPPVQKMAYLLSCLKGEAEKELKGYTVNAGNYDIAKEHLNRRYGNPEALKSALYSELRKIQYASAKTPDIRKMLTDITRVIAQLRETNEDTNNKATEELVQQKLPDWVLLEVIKQKEGIADFNTHSLTDLIDKILKQRETVWELTRNQKIRLNKSENFLAEGKQKESPRRREGEKGRRFSCVFCDDENHTSNRCAKYKTREERVKRLFELKKCLKCFKGDHISKNCTQKIVCKQCQGPHYVTICSKTSSPENNSKKFNDNTPNWRQNQSKGSTQNTHLAEQVESQHKEGEEANEEAGFVEEAYVIEDEVFLASGRNKAILMSGVYKFLNRETGNSKKGIILYDPGSTSTYLSERMTNFLSLKTFDPRTLHVAGYGGKMSSFKTYKTKVYVLGNDKMYYPITAQTSPAMEKSLITTVCKSENSESKPEVKEIKVHPDMLLGIVDFWNIFVKTENLSPRVFCIHTKLGPLVCGEIGSNKNKAQLAYVSSEEYDIGGPAPRQSSATNFWELEGIGINDSPDPSAKEEENKAYEYFHKTVEQQADGRYQVAWPWKQESPSLSSNFGLAFGRLNSFWKRHDFEILDKCRKLLMEQLAMDMIETAPRETDYLCHYIPHQVVIKKNSAFTKIRMVFDPSARTKEGVTLNQQLHVGPNLMPKLAGVLLRQRSYKILMICDIEKAFLQLSLRESDRDVTRFLWLRNIREPPSFDNLLVLRFNRVPFGYVSSPFLLVATILLHLSKEKSQLADELALNLYMDNMSCSVENVKDGLKKYKEIKGIFEKAKMNVREFLTNNVEINSNIPNADLHPDGLPPEEEEAACDDTRTSLLGLPWYHEYDKCEIHLPNPCLFTMTKRELLSLIHSIFDPLGVVAPLLLDAKLLYQNVCRRDIKWDDKLLESEMVEIRRIVSDWRGRRIMFPRHVVHGKTGELHGFVDSSEDAFATGIYFKSEATGEVHLVFSKNRVKPINKKVSIPRLELLAMLIGVRAAKFVRDELKLDIKRVVMWGDSHIVLHWIRSPALDEKDRFVRNRLVEIQTHTDFEFKYVPTQENPADISTRGAKTEEFKKNTLWWNGPSWLKLDSTKWPNVLSVDVPKPDETVEEDIVLKAEVVENEYESSSLDPRRYSSFWRMVYTMMFMLRFCKILLIKCKILPKEAELNSIGTDHISSSDIDTAQRLLIKEAQQRCPPSEKDKKEHQIFEDEHGIMRCRSRLQNKVGSFDFANPIYLPKADHFTSLLVLSIHQKLFHANVQAVLTEFRQKYFMNSARSTIKSILKTCRGNCRDFFKFQLDKMPPYPTSRVERSPVFEHIGLDFLGPLTMKRGGLPASIENVYKAPKSKKDWPKKPVTVRQGGEPIKVWILLLTCLTSRAVHLETVTEMTTMAFLNAFRKFVARRTRPRTIVSDNGSSFVLGQKVLEKLWFNIPQEDEVITYMAKEGIKWHFNTPLSPWSGGVFERINGLIKNSFRKAIGRKVLEEEDFNVFVCEVEAILNSRPLIPIVDELDSFVLRPIDFIYPHAKQGLPSGDSDEDPSWLPKNVESAEKLVEIWRKKSVSINNFWEIWSTEYLNVLRERTPFHRQNKNAKESLPKIGEVVYVHDDNLLKGNWKLGRVVEVISPRKIGVKMPNGNILYRAPSLLYSLEIPSEAQGKSTSDNEECNLMQVISADGRRVVRNCTKTQKIFLPFLLIASIIFSACGQSPMICPVKEASQYWRIEENLLPCANFTIDPPFPTEQTFDIFMPNLDLVEISVAHCAIIEQKIKYKTDLLNNPHSYTTLQNLSVGIEECKRMWNYGRCVEGSLFGDENSKSTQNLPDVEFTYWHFGYENASARNCYLTESKIYAKPGVRSLSSPIVDLSHCKFDEASCVLGDGSILIWDADENDIRLCKYKKLEKWSGTFMGNIWISENGIFGFSFESDSIEVEDCGRTLKISQQGFAVPSVQFELMASKKKRRTKRSMAYEAKDGNVRSSQLSAELTASQVLSTNATRRAFNHLASLICSKKSNLDGLGSLLGGINPTHFARVALNNSYLHGNWISSDVLETRSCLPIPASNISFSASTHCYSNPAVNVTILDRTVRAFLEQKTLIIVEAVPESSCEHHQFITFVMEKKIMKVDQLTGTVKIIPEKDIHPLRLGSFKDNDKLILEPHAFYNYIITNYTDPKVQTIQMFQSVNLERRFEKEKIENEIFKGNWGEFMHKTEARFNDFLPNWTGFTWNISWKEAWSHACSLYVTYLFLLDVVLPFLIRRALTYTNLDQLLNVTLRERMWQSSGLQSASHPSDALPMEETELSTFSPSFIRKINQHHRKRRYFARARSVA